MRHRELVAFIDGRAVCGPGLSSWAAAEAVLAGGADYVAAPLTLPAPTMLPAAERRRAGRVVRLAIALGLEAAGQGAADVAQLATVFASSGADGDNCHALCETLASAQRELSPTRFHNSVHNAAAGYWSIATHAMTASTALAAYDASFSAGLLEALTQVFATQAPVLLIACDCDYPAPLRAKRPLLEGFGVALLLAPARGEHSIMRLAVELVAESADACVDHCLADPLEQLRTRSPAARALPLFELIARRQAGSVDIEYLRGAALRAAVTPC